MQACLADPQKPDCTEVDRARGFVIIKDDDPAKPMAWLIVPDHEVTGIESPAVLRPPVEDFWRYGWQAGETLLPGRAPRAGHQLEGRPHPGPPPHPHLLPRRGRGEDARRHPRRPRLDHRAHPRRPRLPRPPHRRAGAEPLPPPRGAPRRRSPTWAPSPSPSPPPPAAASSSSPSRPPTPRPRISSTRPAPVRLRRHDEPADKARPELRHRAGAEVRRAHDPGLLSRVPRQGAGDGICRKRTVGPGRSSITRTISSS